MFYFSDAAKSSRENSLAYSSNFSEAACCFENISAIDVLIDSNPFVYVDGFNKLGVLSSSTLVY